MTDAVEIIYCAAQLPVYQLTPESQRILDDLALAAQIEATLIKDYPHIEAFADDRKIHVSVKAPLSLKRKLTSKIKDAVRNIKEVKEVHVNIIAMREKQ